MPLIDIIKAGNQIHKGRFARTGSADDTDDFASRSGEIDVVQNNVSGIGIRHTDVIETDNFTRGGGRIRAVRIRVHCGRYFQQILNAATASDGLSDGNNKAG